MERDEAKAILELCRPGNEDDRLDPMIAEALALLETDAELKAWFEEQQTLDRRIGDCYCELEPPSDLKASILVGMRAHADNSKPEVEEEPIPFAQPAGSASQAWWRNPWVGVAAVFAIMFFIVAAPHGDQGAEVASAPEHSYQADIPTIVEFLASEIDAVTRDQRSFAKRSKQPAALQAYLASEGVPSPNSLPHPVDSKPSIGCFTFDYKGISMGMICFNQDELMHLTTVRKTDCMGDFPSEPVIYEIRDQSFKVWVEDEQIQILSVHGSKEKLPEFI